MPEKKTSFFDQIKPYLEKACIAALKSVVNELDRDKTSSCTTACPYYSQQYIQQELGRTGRTPDWYNVITTSSDTTNTSGYVPADTGKSNK